MGICGARPGVHVCNQINKLNVNCELVWGETEFDLLGIKFTVELHKILDLNYKHALIKIENTLHCKDFYTKEVEFREITLNDV